MECKFKVGETYNTRDGQDVVIDAIRPGIDSPYKMVVFVAPHWKSYTLDGRLYEDGNSPFDLILPPRVVWIVLGDTSLAYWADTEEEAKKFGGNPVRVELPA